MDILKAGISANLAYSTRLAFDKLLSNPASVPDRHLLAMVIYLPDTYLDQAKLEQHAGVSSGKYTVGLSQTRMGSCRRSTRLPGQGRHRRDH